jgi:lipoic acid synthetase
MLKFTRYKSYLMQALAKPSWIKARLPSEGLYPQVKAILRRHRLHTVCEEALCPNLGECWGGGTATIMILGDICTRACRFCAVKSGNPNGYVDEMEPVNVAKAVKEMGLKYVVLTSVCRDDLYDGGASIYAKTVRAIREYVGDVFVEVLIPDFNGDRDALEEVVAAGPHVVAHNIETIRRLTPVVRDRRASYDKSLSVLKLVKEISPSTYTKSSIMVGLGEKPEEVLEAMRDLRNSGVDFITVGQYLRPTLSHIPVAEYVHPSVFEYYRSEALKMGFKYAACGPLVRSSYKAGEFYLASVIRGE